MTRVIVPPTRDLAGRRVALVDDLSRTGDTFRIALHELRRVGVRTVTVALVRREPGFRPDMSATTASAVDKVAFPWGREELVKRQVRTAQAVGEPRPSFFALLLTATLNSPTSSKF